MIDDWGCAQGTVSNLERLNILKVVGRDYTQDSKWAVRWSEKTMCLEWRGLSLLVNHNVIVNSLVAELNDMISRQ